MTLDEACQLAQEIEASFMGWDVVSVGRFVPPEEITPRMPWKVCVTIDGEAKPKVIESKGDALAIKFDHQEESARVNDGMLF